MAREKGEEGGIDEGALEEAAAALSREIAEFERLTTSSEKSRLNTQKNIARAAHAVQEAAECQERVDTAVKALLAAIQGAQARHVGNVKRLQERAVEIQERAKEIHTFLERLTVLGDDAKGVAGLLAEWSQGATPDRKAFLDQAIDRVDTAIRRGEELREDASKFEMFDAAREAETLRGQLEAARAKLLRLAGRPPE